MEVAVGGGVIPLYQTDDEGSGHSNDDGSNHAEVYARVSNHCRENLSILKKRVILYNCKQN